MSEKFPRPRVLNAPEESRPLMSSLDNLRRARREEELADLKEKQKDDPHDSWDPAAFERSLTKPVETRAEQMNKLKNLVTELTGAPQKSMREQLTPTPAEVKAATAHLPPFRERTMREKLTPTLSEVQAATAHLREFKEKPTAPAPIMPEMRIEPAKFVPQEGALVLSPEEIEEAAKRLREERESRVGALARKGAAFVRRMRGGGSRKIPRVKRVSRGTEKKSG